MSEEDRLKLENELLLTKSKAQMINLYLDLQQKVEEKNKEIDRLNNIIKDLLKDIEIIVECEDINITKMQLNNYHLRNCLYKLKKLKEE